eukprot:TRINITY_DN88276_c0_g1_i1.p1 TRINITY_DN88276_c0_g1~~TRINITY_DN88276_c0_g1_i1.p1  ORF type:complete len:803 (-),score=129.09 TRINITY_DN88276_c0_g1_i1:289-2646(-)
MAHAKKAKEQFRQADVNGDGVISYDEFKAVFHALGDFADGEVDKLLQAADKNLDGKLNYNEFLDWLLSKGVSGRWTTEEFRFSGSWYGRAKKELIQGDDCFEVAKEKLRLQPEKYCAVSCKYKYTQPGASDKWQLWAYLYSRDGGFRASDPEPDGKHICVQTVYHALPEATFKDDFTDQPWMQTLKDQEHDWARPGRGQGLNDDPGLDLFGKIDPGDINQGGIGDCWLMCSIAAVAEFPEAVRSLFCGAKALSEEGKYDIKIFDIPSKSWKTFTIDDRLPQRKQNKTYRFASSDNGANMWVSLLEKAFAVQAGGYQCLVGGQPYIAYVMLTGCLNSFQIRKDKEADEWDIITRGWETYTQSNDDHDPTYRHSNPGKLVWGSWDLSGMGRDKVTKQDKEIFDLLADWDSKNYLMAAATWSNSGSDENDTDGIYDRHAYSVLAVKAAVCDKFDMILFRNPHGSGEYRGPWADGGYMWDEHPDVREALGYSQELDDGAWWMTMEDAVKYFACFYVCAHEMAKPGEEGVKQPIHTKTSDKPDTVSKPTLAAGFLVGTWLHSKSGAEITIAVHEDTITMVHPQTGEKTYPASSFLVDGKFRFSGYIGEVDVTEDEHGTAVDVICWNNGVRWTRVLTAVGFLGKWKHSSGAVIQISIDGDTVSVEHPISGLVTISKKEFVVDNVVRYKGYYGNPDSEWSVITFNNGVTWTRMFEAEAFAGDWLHSRTNQIISITRDGDEMVIAHPRAGESRASLEEFFVDGSIHWKKYTGVPNAQQNAITWNNGVVWSRRE